MMADASILLVEDDPNDAHLTLRAFKKGGIAARVTHVCDGDEALAFLFPETSPPPALPTVVLLDWKLPKVGGLEVLIRIRAEPRTHHLPVVILTSSREERDVAAAYASGANSYVTKPIEPGQFEAAARELGQYWLGRNEVLHR